MPQDGDVRRYGLYGEASRIPTPELVHIERIATRSAPHDWRIAPHAHPGIFQMLFLESGSADLACDGKRWDIAPATLIALPSSCVHAFHFLPGSEGWVVSVAIDLFQDSRLAVTGESLPVLSGAASVLALADDPAQLSRCAWLCRDLDARLTAAQGKLTSAVLALVTLLLAIAQESQDMLPKRSETPPTGRLALAQRYRLLVDAHYREHWSVAQFASRLGTTVPTLTRACREMFDRAPGELLLDRLLLEAMRLLTYSSASIKEIADRLGFADPAYFARFFKTRTGVRASCFRQERSWLR